jgi:hypothetical protein
MITHDMAIHGQYFVHLFPSLTEMAGGNSETLIAVDDGTAAGGMLPMLPDRQWFNLNAKLGSSMALPQKIKKDTQG